MIEQRIANQVRLCFQKSEEVFLGTWHLILDVLNKRTLKVLLCGMIQSVGECLKNGEVR